MTLHIPKIRALDLTLPTKFFGGMDSDPDDAWRTWQRLNRRRVAVGLRPYLWGQQGPFFPIRDSQ